TNPRADFSLINRGEIILTERLIVIDKTEIPNFTANEQSLKEYSRRAETTKKFKFTNKGKVEVTTNVYFIVNNYRDFMTTGILRLLTEEGIGSSPVSIIENTGSITKRVEIVHGLSPDEARQFEAR
ncbi:hypothetical protein PENTCL1PPCAC_27351, partial [Pristionchus entomophagus]